MTHIISEFNERRHYDRINTWLQSPGADMLSPSDSVYNTVYTFVYELTNRHMKLSIDADEIAHKLCGYTCRMYETRHSTDRLYHVSNASYPEEWTHEHETLWADYMMYTFDSSFWHKLWKQLRPADWEYELQDWRDKIASALPTYIKRNKQVLIRAGWMDPECDQSDDCD